MKKALFLDRDGIINIDHGYVYEISTFEFMEGIFEVCANAQEKGYEIFIITNQSGIARGYYSIEDFNTVTNWMLSKFEENNIYIKDVYFCPHHPDKGINEYKQTCICRKPAPGMINKAAKQYEIDVTNSVFIGDKNSDMEAANNALIKTRILFNTENNLPPKLATHQVNVLTDALKVI